jgi:hypothetical protein
MDPTGAVVCDVMTDVQGDASCALPDGGTVTVLQAETQLLDGIPHERFEHLETYRGVQPTDVLLAGPAKDPTVLAGVTATMTADMQLDEHEASTFFECGGGTALGMVGGPQQQLSFYDSCKTPTFDLLTILQVETAREFAWQTGIPLVDGGTVQISDDLHVMGTLSATIANIPANVGIVGGTLTVMIGSFPLELGLESVQSPPPGAMTMPLAYPPGVGASTIVTIGAQLDGAPNNQWIAVSTATPTTFAFDIDEMPLPSLSTIATESTTGVTWSETGAGNPDARYVFWSANWPDATGLPHQATWVIVEPPTPATSSTLPPLPDAHAADDPTRVDPMKIVLPVFGGAVIYLDYDNLAGYDDARVLGATLHDLTGTMTTVDHRAHASRTIGL